MARSFPAASVAALRSSGIVIAKAQLSSALRVVSLDPTSAARLEEFGLPLDQFLAIQDEPDIRAVFAQLNPNEPGETATKLVKEASVGHLPVEVSIARIPDEGGFVLVLRDITQRKETEQQVQTLVYYDSVTRLPNRTLLQDRLGKALHRGTNVAAGLAAVATAGLAEFRQYLYYYNVTADIPELPLYKVPDETRDGDAREPLL